MLEPTGLRPFTSEGHHCSNGAALCNLTKAILKRWPEIRISKRVHPVSGVNQYESTNNRNITIGAVLFKIPASLTILKIQDMYYLGAAEVQTTRNVRMRVLIAIILHNSEMPK